MRILVISDYDQHWNAIRPEGEMYRRLQQQPGIEVSVMSVAASSYCQHLAQHGVRIIDFAGFRGKWDREGTRFLRAELERGQYDLLHLYNNTAVANGVRAARGLPVRVAAYRGYTGNINWWDPTIYLTYLHPRLNGISCVSAAVQQIFEQLPRVVRPRTAVVSKGHDLAWYTDVSAADLSAYRPTPQHLVVTLVANARRMKGTTYLAAAIAQLPPGLPLSFLWVGRGLDSPAVRRLLARSSYATHNYFTGFRADVLAVLKASDISVLPSIKGEGLSKVLLESMFLGVPTIMTDIGGNRGLGIDGQTTLVVPAGQATPISQALQRLATDADLRQRIGAAGRSYVQQHFTAERSAQELLAFYRALLATPPPV